jgi:3'-phosphoadenosine 5'-phosphosulfate sulfotransferase (PAPS reductase)/FAD synthetase
MDEGERALYLATSRLRSHRARVDRTRERIAEAFASSRLAYVSFSGGKDSTVVLHLAQQLRHDVLSCFYDSGAELPSTYQLVRHVQDTWTTVLSWCYPQRTILDILRAVGIGHNDATESLRAGQIADEIIKDVARTAASALGTDCYMLGLRRDESAGRKADLNKRGALYRMLDGQLRCCPIWDWTDDDVWAYIVSNEVEYNEAYDRTALRQRREIRVCTYAGNTSERYGRFAWLKHEYPDLFRRLAAEFRAIGAMT